MFHSSHAWQDGYICSWLTTPPLLRLGMEPSYCQSKSTGFWFSRNDLPECGGHSGTSFWYSTILLTTCITAHMYNVALTSLDIHLFLASWRFCVRMRIKLINCARASAGRPGAQRAASAAMQSQLTACTFNLTWRGACGRLCACRVWCMWSMSKHTRHPCAGKIWSVRGRTISTMQIRVYIMKMVHGTISQQIWPTGELAIIMHNNNVHG